MKELNRSFSPTSPGLSTRARGEVFVTECEDSTPLFDYYTEPGTFGRYDSEESSVGCRAKPLGWITQPECWDESPALLDGVCSDDKLQRCVSDVSAGLTFGQRGSFPASTNEPHIMACMNQGSNATCQANQVHSYGYFARCQLCVCRSRDDWCTTDGSQIETLYDGCASQSEVDSSPLNYSCYVHPALLQHAWIETLITDDSCVIRARRV
jgi:hypothetical protein